MTDTTETTTTETTTTETTEPKKIEFSPEQSEWISKKIAAEVKNDRDKRAAADAEAKKKADADAERKRQEEAGEFDKVRQSIEAERDTAAGERDSLKAENEVYARLFEAQYAEDVKAIPPSIWDVIKPADDASLTVRIEQLQKAKKLADEFGTTAPAGGGSRPTPKPTRSQGENEQETLRNESRARAASQI